MENVKANNNHIGYFVSVTGATVPLSLTSDSITCVSDKTTLCLLNWDTWSPTTVSVPDIAQPSEGSCSAACLTVIYWTCGVCWRSVVQQMVSTVRLVIHPAVSVLVCCRRGDVAARWWCHHQLSLSSPGWFGNAIGLDNDDKINTMKDTGIKSGP